MIKSMTIKTMNKIVEEKKGLLRSLDDFCVRVKPNELRSMVLAGASILKCF